MGEQKHEEIGQRISLALMCYRLLLINYPISICQNEFLLILVCTVETVPLSISQLNISDTLQVTIYINVQVEALISVKKGIGIKLGTFQMILHKIFDGQFKESGDRLDE
jgi:hypothetical protein